MKSRGKPSASRSGGKERPCAQKGKEFIGKGEDCLTLKRALLYLNSLERDRPRGRSHDLYCKERETAAKAEEKRACEHRKP